MKNTLDDDFYNCSPWIRFDNYNWSNSEFDTYLKVFPKNEVIYRQKEYSDFVYIIKKSRVRLSIFSKDGNEKCLTIAEEGSMFGELSILDNLPNFTTTTTIVNCELFLIPIDTFKEIIETDKEFLDKVMQSLVRKIRIMSSHVEDLSFKGAYSRVASYLIKLVHSHGSLSSGTYKLNIKFTHQEMADLTGLSRVTVSNVMSYLITQKVISKVKGYIVIQDIEKLFELI